MTTSAGTTTANYYTVLQVHPDAEVEVIEAAYRQLMKLYHPDRAGADSLRIAWHHERAKALNEAFSVLRDPERRRVYDSTRQVVGWIPQAHWSAAASRRGADGAPTDWCSSGPPPEQRVAATTAPVHLAPEPSAGQRLLGVLSAMYFLLPGRYEWEPGSGRELLALALVPPATALSYALATGRLAAWIGNTAQATWMGWALVVLLAVPILSSFPRVVLAGLPSLALLTGRGQALLNQVHTPAWLAWAGLGVLGLILAPRVYVFAVLPTLGILWLMVQLG